MSKFEQDRKAALAGKYNYLNPKKSSNVPHEYIKTVVLRGTGFAGGKGRVCEIFKNEIDAGTRAKRIKAEYGIGGAGWPVEGYGLHGYDTFHGSGLRFQWRDVHEDKFGKGMWIKLPAEGHTTLRRPVVVGEKPDGKKEWGTEKNSIANADLKKMVEAYKERPRESVKGRLAEKKAEAVTQKPAQKTQSKSKSKEAEL